MKNRNCSLFLTHVNIKIEKGCWHEISGKYKIYFQNGTISAIKYIAPGEKWHLVNEARNP